MARFFSKVMLSKAAKRKEPILASGSFSAANYYQTAVDGGELGIAAGFVSVALYRLDSSPVTSAIFDRAPSTAGYGVGSGNAVLNCYFGGSSLVVPTHPVYASDFGKLFLVVGVHTGTTVDIWTHRRRVISSAITGYTAGTGLRVTLGARVSGQYPASYASLVAAFSARGVPSNTQIEALFDYVRLNGELPSSIPTSNYFGVKGFDSAANILQTDVNKGVKGSKTTGVWTAIVVTVYATPPNNEVPAGDCNDPSYTAGWFFQQSGGKFHFFTIGSMYMASDGYTFQASDFGVPRLFIGEHTGSANGNVMRLWGDNGQVGVDQTRDVFNDPVNSRTRVGIWSTYNSKSFAVHALGGGTGTLTTQQRSDIITAFKTTGKLALPTGQHLWEVTTDIAANGPQYGVPATIKDRIGTDDLTRNGSLNVSGYADITHRWSLKEAVTAQPLLPLAGFSTSRQLEVGGTGGMRGNASGTWCAVLAEITQIGGNECFASAMDPNGGWDIMKYSNTLLVGRRSPTYISTNAYTFQAGDLNRKILVGFDHDGSSLRAWFDGVQQGASAAAAGMTASAIYPMVVGGQPNAGYAAVNTRIYGVVGGEGSVPTPAQWAQLATDSAAGVIGSVPGKTTHRWQLASTNGAIPAYYSDTVGTDPLNVVGGSVAPLAPTSLTDTVTAASLDRMDRVGNPVVRAIDPAVDGRVSYGVTGFGSANYLKSDNGKGIRGAAAGFTVRCVVTFWSIAAGTEGIAACTDTPGSNGWCWYRTTTSLIASVGAGTPRTSQKTLAAADLGIPHILHLVMDAAGAVTLYFDGVASTASATGAWSDAGASFPNLIGVLSTSGNYPNASATVHSLAGNHVIATAAEVLTDFYVWKTTGQLSNIPGKPDLHRYDFTQDVLANGGSTNGVPSTVLDRVGTDHLTRSSGWGVEQGGLVSLEADIVSTATYARTVSVTPSFTASAAGFYIEGLAYWTLRAQTATDMLACHGRFAGTHGWWIRAQADSAIYAMISDGTLAKDFGIPIAGVAQGFHHFALVYTGTQGHIYFDGVLKTTVTCGFAPETTEPLMIGGLRSGAPIYKIVTHPLLGLAMGNFVPDASEIATASSAALSAKKIVGVPGKHTVRYSIADDIIEAGGRVPTIIKERVSGTDNMSVLSAPLQVSQQKNRLWSYDTVPIFNGAEAFTATNYYAASLNTMPGHMTGFTVSLLFKVTAQVSASIRSVFNQNESAVSAGWEMWLNAGATTMNFAVGNGTSNYNSPTATIATGDVGKLLLITGVFDAPSNLVRLYFKRVQQGTGTAFSGTYSPRTNTQPGIGRRSIGPGGASAAANDTAVYGVQYALGIATLAQIQAHHDAVMAGERMVQIPGMTGTVIDLTLDGGAAATLTDRDIGGVNFTRAGTPTTAPHYARNWCW